MPLSGFAVTNSGKTSPKSYKPASEVIALERKEFPTRSIFPEKFPVPVVCSEFCGKVDRCNLRENGFSDLCKHNHLLGTLVKASPAKFRRHAREERSPVIWVKSSSRSMWLDDHESNWKTDRFGNYSHYTNPKLVPHTALVHERTEDSSFAAYSSQKFLDTYDDPEEGCELEYTMDTGMISPDKSQAGLVPSFIYRTTYREKRILLGFENRRVQRVYSKIERMWFIQNGKPVYAEVEVSKVTEYTESMPVYKWIRQPTLRPIGCYLKPMKVIGSTTVMTRKEQRFFNDLREGERQNRHHQKVLIRQDEIEAQKQVVLATC